MIFGPSASQRLARARAERRRRGERGAVAIEAALLTPLLCCSSSASSSSGFLFKDWLAVTSSVRAGTRMASAEPRVATFAQDAADQVAKEGAALDMGTSRSCGSTRPQANGYPVGGTSAFTACSVCVKFHWNSDDQEVRALLDHLDGHPAERLRGRRLPRHRRRLHKITHQGVTGLVFNEMTIEEHSVMSLEPIPTTKTCK